MLISCLPRPPDTKENGESECGHSNGQRIRLLQNGKDWVLPQRCWPLMRCRSHLQPPTMVILSLVVLKKNTLRNDASLKQTRGKVRYLRRQSEDLSARKEEDWSRHCAIKVLWSCHKYRIEGNTENQHLRKGRILNVMSLMCLMQLKRPHLMLFTKNPARFNEVYRWMQTEELT